MVPEIKLLKKENGEWFDIESKTNQTGLVYAFSLKDQQSGEWLLNVKVSNQGKIVVTAETTSQTTSIHDQIKRQSMVLKPYDSNKVYQLLGISSLDNGRVSKSRVDDIKTLDKEVVKKFNLDRYSLIKKDSNLANKIIAIVNKDEIEKIVYLFYLEKIKPLF